MSESTRKIVGLVLVAVGIWLPQISEKLDWLPIPGVVSTAPFEADKLCVLIVEETEDRIKLPQAQTDAMFGAALAEYIEAKGGTLRQLDDDTVDPPREEKWVKAALKLDRGQSPWLFISNGKSGFSGPLPADTDALMAELKKHGGE